MLKHSFFPNFISKWNCLPEYQRVFVMYVLAVLPVVASASCTLYVGSFIFRQSPIVSRTSITKFGLGPIFPRKSDFVLLVQVRSRVCSQYQHLRCSGSPHHLHGAINVGVGALPLLLAPHDAKTCERLWQ